MNSMPEGSVTRIATLGFAPPPRINLPTSVFYTDIDNETGERSRVPVTRRATRRSREEVFEALLKMMLVELAHELDIDPRHPPSWLPEIDDALDANLVLTAEELHERLLDEMVAEETENRSAHSMRQSGVLSSVTLGCIYDLPRLLSEISLAFEDVDRRGGVSTAFMDPTEAARADLIQHAVARATSPIAAFERMFGIVSLDLVKTKLAIDFLQENQDFEPLGIVDDLVVATAVAWTTNVATSVTKPSHQQRIGFWLCDANAVRISKVIALELRRDDSGIKFDLNLSDNLGRAELETMNRAIESLAHARSTPELAVA